MEVRYYGLSEAVKVINCRRKSLNLDEIRRTYNFPDGVDGCLLGFLGRHIASARLEELQFWKRCRSVGLKPLWLEYLDDTFVTNNPSKARLCKIRVVLGKSKDGRLKERVLRIVDSFHPMVRKVGEVETVWGESLASFHHRVLKELLPNPTMYDISGWLKSIGKAQAYYESYLALALAHGILFESFESPGFPDLERFKHVVVLPAYKRLVERWGVPPVIVYHPVAKNEDFYLKYYPPEVLKFIPEK